MPRPAAMRRFSGWLVLSATVAAVILAAAAIAAQSNTVQTVTYGKIVSAKPVTIQDAPSGKKRRRGATVGAIAGAAVAGHRDRWFGAVVGGAVGSAADQAGLVKQGTELVIKLDSGQEIAIQIPGEQEYKPGDKVRLTTGPNGTKVQRVEADAAAAEEPKKAA